NKIFKVTKSIPVARSSFFRDMVAFPQPEGDEASEIDGSSIVPLHDTVADVEVFHSPVDHPGSYFMPPLAPIGLDAVLGILRLSHKYDVQYLYLRAFQHLTVRYGPVSLEAYRTPYDDDHIIYTDDRPLRYLKVIDAATQVGALWLLPVPYYLASGFHQTVLRSMIALGADEQHVHACLDAHPALIRGTTKVFSFLSDPGSAQCRSRGDYHTGRLMLLSDFFPMFMARAGCEPPGRVGRARWRLGPNKLLPVRRLLRPGKEQPCIHP
ncbi:hypothetical protein FB451DRAFT_1057099, partial [Mycena latifolia]